MSTGLALFGIIFTALAVIGLLAAMVACLQMGQDPDAARRDIAEHDAWMDEIRGETDE